MTSSVVGEVLVGPLRADDRRTDLLARLDQLPARFQTVLRGCYLQGRGVEDVAEQCSLTPRELAQLRTDALVALGRLRAARPVRRAMPSPYG